MKSALSPGATALLFERFADVARELLAGAFVQASRDDPALYEAVNAAVGAKCAALALVVEFSPSFTVSVRMQGVIDGAVQDVLISRLSDGSDHPHAGHA